MAASSSGTARSRIATRSVFNSPTAAVCSVVGGNSAPGVDGAAMARRFAKARDVSARASHSSQERLQVLQAKLPRTDNGASCGILACAPVLRYSSRRSSAATTAAATAA